MHNDGSSDRLDFRMKPPMSLPSSSIQFHQSSKARNAVMLYSVLAFTPCIYKTRSNLSFYQQLNRSLLIMMEIGRPLLVQQRDLLGRLRKHTHRLQQKKGWCVFAKFLTMNHQRMLGQVESLILLAAFFRTQWRSGIGMESVLFSFHFLFLAFLHGFRSSGHRHGSVDIMRT